MYFSALQSTSSHRHAGAIGRVTSAFFSASFDGRLEEFNIQVSTAAFPRRQPHNGARPGHHWHVSASQRPPVGHGSARHRRSRQLARPRGVCTFVTVCYFEHNCRTDLVDLQAPVSPRTAHT